MYIKMYRMCLKIVYVLQAYININVFCLFYVLLSHSWRWLKQKQSRKMRAREREQSARLTYSIKY